MHFTFHFNIMLSYLKWSRPFRVSDQDTELPLFLVRVISIRYLLSGTNHEAPHYVILPSLKTPYSDTLSLCSPLNPLTPNDPYRGRTAPLTPKRCILYIYSTNIGTEYFKHGIYSPSFPLQNAVCSIILTHLVPVLFTCYIQVC